MVKSKRIFSAILFLILLFTLLISLWPRSLLGSMDTEIKSMSVAIIEESFEHEQDTYTFDAGDPEFDKLTEVFGRYYYHMSMGTVANYIKQNTHLEGNDAGYWLNIYLYTEPDCQGDCYQIISGGTGEVIINSGVYRMGYWGNRTALKFMDEVCQFINSWQKTD